MLDQAALHLIGGGFICETSKPNLYRWLESEHNKVALDAWLQQVGRKLATTPSGLAYYAAWTRIGSDERGSVSQVFGQVKRVLRPLVRFIALYLDTTGADQLPQPGRRVEFSPLLQAVSTNPVAFEQLRDLGSLGKDLVSSDATAKGMLEKAFRALENWGYIVAVKRDQGIFRFTGKIDYFYWINDFLIDHDTVEIENLESALDDQQMRLM